MILITAKANVSEEKRVSYLKLCAEQVENSREEEGCLDYGFYEDAMARQLHFCGALERSSSIRFSLQAKLLS